MKLIIKKIERNISEMIYLFLIFFFCYTAFNKLMNIESFRINLMKTSLFDEEMAKYLSIIVIVGECLLIIVLLLYKRLGLLILTFTLVLFTIYISYLRYKGLYEVCGCGGVLNGLEYKYHLAINVSLTIGAFFSLLIFSKKEDARKN